MSFSAAATLPRTRSLHRVRSRRGWWLAVGITVAANIAVIVALAQVSRLAHAPAPPTLTVHRLSRIEPDPPPPPTPPEAREAAPDEAVVEALAPALPLLDVPMAAATGIALPNLGSLDVPSELPVIMPTVSAALPVGETAIAPLTITGMAVDSPATRQGAFDLDRFFPRAAKARGISGTSRIRSRIDAHGRVTAVEVLESRPPGVFEPAAERLGRAQRYEPARRAGSAVPTVQDTVIEWKLP